MFEFVTPIVTEIVRIANDHGIDTFALDESPFLDSATIAYERERYEQSIDGVGMADTRYL
jgi:hypothetical protein